MSSRTLLIVFLALAFGLSASLGVNMLLNARASAPPATVGVVAAAVAIPRGGMLTREQVKTIEFPRDLVPPGAITKIEDALDRGVFNPLVPNEPIRRGDDLECAVGDATFQSGREHWQALQTT